jgi:hypothetical protein
MEISRYQEKGSEKYADPKVIVPHLLCRIGRQIFGNPDGPIGTLSDKLEVNQFSKSFFVKFLRNTLLLHESHIIGAFLRLLFGHLIIDCHVNHFDPFPASIITS